MRNEDPFSQHRDLRKLFRRPPPPRRRSHDQFCGEVLLRRCYLTRIKRPHLTAGRVRALLLALLCPRHPPRVVTHPQVAPDEVLDQPEVSIEIR